LSANASNVSVASFASISARNWMARLVIAVVIGVVVGAILFGLLFKAWSTDTTAVSFIRLSQPVDLTAIAGGASQTTPDTSGNAEKYVAGEVAYLTGDGFGQAVARKLGKSQPPTLKVVQDGSSAVVTLSSTADSGDEAVRTLQAAIDVYGQQLAQRADQQLRAILPALAQWEQSAAESGNAPRAQDIQAMRQGVQLQAAQPNAITVLQPPTVANGSGHRFALGAALGALFGGALGVLGVTARRRRSGHLSSPADIAGAIDGVLVPAVDLRLPPPHLWREEHCALARTLYAQCPSSGPQRIMVVIGASRSSGAGAVASLLSFAAGENGTVAAFALNHGPIPPLPAPDHETTLVIDAGALGDSRLTPEAIGLATDIVIVARLDVDTLAHTLAVCSAISSSEAPKLAAFTYSSWWGFSSGDSRKPTASDEEVPTAEPDGYASAHTRVGDSAGPVG
jgi:hypothetical protein